jgi:hypothetical protein
MKSCFDRIPCPPLISATLRPGSATFTAQQRLRGNSALLMQRPAPSSLDPGGRAPGPVLSGGA